MKNNSVVFCDYETYSECEIKYGGFRYAQDPSTEIICLAYSFDGKNIKFWKPGMPEPKDFTDHIRNGGLVRAWNVSFEYAITNYVAARIFNWPKIKPEQVLCTMSDALALALPASLAACGEALDLPIQKDKRGKYLIQKLSKPRKPTKNKPYTRITPEIEPELFQEFYEYNIRDVEAEVAIFNYLPKKLKGKELELFRLTLKINERGIPVDVELVNAVMREKKKYEIRLNNEIKNITCGELANTNSRPQSLKWLEANGLKLPGYTKGDISKALEKEGLSKNVKRFLEIRSELSRTPIKKFDFIVKALCSDGTIKNNIIYHKATTGRFAGAGFQIQNLPRDAAENVEELIEKFKSGDTRDLNVYNKAIKLIRPVLTAFEGQKLVVSDFSSIENRKIAWVAEDFETLDKFEKGLDQYKDTAVDIYGVKYDNVTKDQRQLGKIAVLSCGFGGGWKTFQTVCRDSWGINVTDEEAQHIVDSYRAKYWRVKNLWYGLYDAALEAVSSPGVVTGYNSIRFRTIGDFLYMKLPSKRFLAYYKPELKKVTTPWGAEKLALTHMGSNTYTRKWERLVVIPGRLTENAVQAIARDALTDAMLEVEKEGYPIIGCVHDEIISMVKEDFGSIEHFNEIMGKNPDWAPDCPIECEGYEDKRYRK